MASSEQVLSPRQAQWSIDDHSLERFVRALSQPASSDEWFRVRRSAEELALLPGFDTLIALDHNRIEELPHQIDVAMRVLRHMGGRALLADEVGLGKTIEAGLILKELAVRGLARRILILTPAALVDQWCGELESKFFEEFETPHDPDDWRRANRAIASYNLAVQKRQQEAILAEPWDLVILDEAHKVKNAQAATYKFISQIRRTTSCCSRPLRSRTTSESSTTWSRCCARASSERGRTFLSSISFVAIGGA